MPNPTVERLPVCGLSALLDEVDALFVDVWGVVHDGVTSIPESCEALVRARQAGKPVLLVSNAPRPAPSIIPFLDKLGVPREAYDGLLTSGDLTREYLIKSEWDWVHHIGPDRDMPVFEGLDVVFADADEADVAIVTGLRDDEAETPKDYERELRLMVEHEVTFVCANPDIVVERGHKLIPCAGALAQMYEGMGGEVIYFGKPHAPVYETALARLSDLAGRTLDARRVLAVGDGIRTDMLGAARAGLPALFVAGGIHAADAGAPDAIDQAKLQSLFTAAKVAPVALTWRVVW